MASRPRHLPAYEPIFARPIQNPKSNRPRPAVPVADLDRLLHRHNEDLAVADVAFVAGAGDLLEALDGFLDEVVVHRDLEGHLAEQVGLVLGAAVGFILAALAGEA